MNKGKNILAMLGFIIITCGQLYGLSPRQLARLRNLENQFNTRLEQGPGENFGAWRAGMQGQVDRMRQIDRPTADYYQRIVQRLGEGEAVREERIGEMKGMEEARANLAAELALRDAQFAALKEQFAAQQRELAAKDASLIAYTAELAKKDEMLAEREKAHFEQMDTLINNVLASFDRAETALRSERSKGVEFTAEQSTQLVKDVEKFARDLGTAENLTDLFNNLSSGAQSDFQYKSYELMKKLNKNFDEIADNTAAFLRQLKKLADNRDLKKEDFDSAVQFLNIMYTTKNLFSHLLDIFAGILEEGEMKEVVQNFHQQKNKLDGLQNELYAIFNVSPASKPGNILINFFGMEEGAKKAKSAIIPDPFPVAPEEEKMTEEEREMTRGGYTKVGPGRWTRTVKPGGR